MDEGSTVGARVTATGGHGERNYALSGVGVDNAKFKINQETGQITTGVKLDYEAAAQNAAANCEVQNGCVVTVVATDAAGVTATATVTINIVDVDEAPMFEVVSDGPPPVNVMTVTVAEDATETDLNLAMYSVDDPEDGNITWSLGGADAGLFKLSNTQVLSFKTLPDYENPTDANRDKEYEVTVQASDGTSSVTRMVTVSVMNANEAPVIAELASSINYPEDRTDAVATLTATDPDVGDTVTWSKSGTDDEAFELGGNDGVLKFADQPDFEIEADNDRDNTYEFTVTATDGGGLLDTFDVVVKVTNVDEEGMVAWTVDPDGTGGVDVDAVNGGKPIVQFQVDAILTATVMDGDSDVSGKVPSGVTWLWYSSSRKTSPGTPIAGEVTRSYTVKESDVGNYIRVVARYNEGIDERTPREVSDYRVLRKALDGDDAPVFNPASATREVDENMDEGSTVGARVTATGGHGERNYALSGVGVDNAKFKINQETGQITTGVKLDYEAAAQNAAANCEVQNGCVVTVVATDAAGVTATATVTINIVDVDEAPMFEVVSDGPPPVNVMTVTVAEDATETDLNLAMYSVDDPEGDNINWSMGGADASLFKLSGTQVLSFKTLPDYENPTDANGDKEYEVTVQASDGTSSVTRMVTVSVMNANEAPVISAGPSIRGESRISYDENSLDDVATYQIVGLETGATVEWSLSGADAGDLTISSGGVLTFDSPPDFEDPADANTDNVYEITVEAGDGTQSAMLDVRVTVTAMDQEVPVDYDRDNDGTVDALELSVAISDYLSGELDPVELSEVIAAYING